MSLLYLLRKLLQPDPGKRLASMISGDTNAEILPKFVGKAKKDRPYQLGVEQGYEMVPDLIRQLAQAGGFKFKAAEKLQEADPTAEGMGVMGTTTYPTKTVSIGNYGEENPSTVVHEMGHVANYLTSNVFDDFLASDVFRDLWEKEAKKAPDLYGSTDSGEGLAELITSLAAQVNKGLPERYSKDYPKAFPKTLGYTKQRMDKLLRVLNKNRGHLKDLDMSDFYPD